MQDARGCLLELEQLAAEGSREKKDELLERVTDLFFLTSEQQSSAAKAVFGDVMERIAYELELKSRARLAERMSEAFGAPHKLIVKLATDEIGVAHPVLAKSPVLKDEDLVSIAAEHGQAHLHAISGRTELSSTVTDVIVVRGDNSVLTHMAGNKGAEFSPHGLVRISERACDDASLYNALEMRTDVPRTLLKEIKQTISERLKAELAKSSSGISDEDIDEIVEDGALEMHLQPGNQARQTVEQKTKRQTISDEMILLFARKRKLTESVQCLSIMSGVSLSKVSHCLLTADLSALAVLCKFGNLKNGTFAALIQLRSSSNPVSGLMIADAMRHYDMLTVDTARKALHAIHQRTAQSDPN
jgi:uncharacterized protein (DUF2336 family)